MNGRLEVSGTIQTCKPTVLRLSLSVLCATTVAWGLGSYPLPAGPLTVAVVLYAAALWRWPALFLVIVPATLPALDLGAWTGWTMAAESDLFVLATIAILALRAPPEHGAWFPKGPTGAALALLTVCFLLSAAIGLATSDTGAALSSNPYLRPDNALRLIKPVLEVLALIPFMRQRHRAHGDMATWLGWGMLAGATAVAVEATIERAVWFGVFDFASGYRVAAAFSSMHVGGGHIGAYVAMTLPFLLGIGLTIRRWWMAPILLGVAIAAGYALVVTFARTAYTAGIVSILVAALAWLVLGWRGSGQRLRQGLALLLVIPLAGGLIAAASFGFMRERVSEAVGSFQVREINWRHVRAVADGGPLSVVFGTGLGTYARAMLARGTTDGTSDFRLDDSESMPYLSITILTPFYFGQKITLPPTRLLHLTFQWRAASPDALFGGLVCEKYLLYSENCRGASVRPKSPGSWEAASMDIQTEGLRSAKVLGFFSRPIELSLASSIPGTTIAVRDVSLTDDFGWNILANGNFRHGLDRWSFTDDQHTAWRIFNMYLMLLFETGVLGLVSFTAMVGLAAVGGARALLRGHAMGAAVLGSIVSFLISGLFDDVFEAPRLAAVFLLVCATGLILREPGNGGQAPEDGRVMDAIPSATPGAGDHAAEIETY
ncbi:MAG: hypothetical protein EXR07_10240 [Acetobacteraceae bacterium]|nr:hypothetical protein [Acetobacteraceae bacterium]